MAIVKMKKFTLLTFKSYKNVLLKELQKFGDVHFKDLQNSDLVESKLLSWDFSPKESERLETELSKVKYALSKISPYINKPKGLKALTAEPKTMDYDEFDVYSSEYNYDSVYENIRSEDEKINTFKSRISSLQAENEGLRSWFSMDVSLRQLEALNYVKVLTGTVSKVSAESFKVNVEDGYKEAYVEFIGNIKDDIIIFIMMPLKDSDEVLQFIKTLGFSRLTPNFSGIPSEVFEANNNEIIKLKKLQDDSFDKIRELSNEYEKLSVVHDYYETVLVREEACRNFLKMQTTILMEGWVPEDDLKKLKDIIDAICGSDYYFEEEEVQKDSADVPIKLKNNKMVAAFEDVTIMFSLPRYSEIDPTPLLMPFYILFFGLMIGDVGYGLILLVGTIAALKFFKLKDGMKKFIEFFFYLSFGVIFAGFLYGSMFGYPFFTPIQTADGTYKAIIDTQADIIMMMIGSVALGIIHVLFGLVVKGYMLVRDGKVFDAIADSLLWIVTLIGFIGLIVGFTGILPGWLKSVISWTFVIGIIGLIATQGRENKSLVGKIGGGLYSVYGITSYVGDFVSYTRIAALLLSGAYIAFSFNLMAELIPAGFLRAIFGTLIFLVGLFINLALSALGAYVHTCRLQYVEFFGKFYEGGGVPFNAFKIKNKYIKINK